MPGPTLPIPLEGPAATGASGASAAVSELISQLVDWLKDPSVNAALSPSAGLQVTPVLFQSIEQEGRWKPQNLVVPTTSAARVFELKTLNGAPSYKIGTINGTKYGKLGQADTTLFTISCSSGSKVVVDALWWCDNLEIYAGFAGMSLSAGFSSQYNDTASIILQAIPFGNYYPAQVLISWTGWVNPVGTAYVEFRGVTVVDAQGGSSAGLISSSQGAIMPGGQLQSISSPPAYMQAWARGQNPPQPLNYDPTNGFTLNANSFIPRSLQTGTKNSQ